MPTLCPANLIPIVARTLASYGHDERQPPAAEAQSLEQHLSQQNCLAVLQCMYEANGDMVYLLRLLLPVCRPLYVTFSKMLARRKAVQGCTDPDELADLMATTSQIGPLPTESDARSSGRRLQQ